ncbi:MAG: tetratricopeptide repeat protein [Planctomycetes bacterium]|nr:tetratricopeptide repeat protein [Planctomycetota bacterium]
MKRLPQTPSWLPMSLHIAHGLVAGGVGYMLGFAAVIYMHAEPGSTRSMVAVVAAFALTVFELAFFVYLILRRKRMRRLWADASAMIKKEEWEAAKFTLRELLKYPEYRLAPAPVLFALGSCAEGSGNEREAMVLYRRCGDFPAALRAMGILQLERGLNDSAAEALRKLVARRPGDTFSVVLLSVALFRGGNRDAAKKVLERALELRPKSEMLRVNLSRVEKGDEPGFELGPQE